MLQLHEENLAKMVRNISNNLYQYITLSDFGKIMDLSFLFGNGQIKLNIERIGDLS